MRAAWRYRWAACFLALCLALAAPGTFAEDTVQPQPNLSSLSTGELLERASIISSKLSAQLEARPDQLKSLQTDNESLQQDLATTRKEASELRAELEKRSKQADESVQESQDLKTAIGQISSLLGISETYSQNSVDEAEKAIQAMADKANRAQREATTWKGIASVTTVISVILGIIHFAGGSR